MKRSKSSSVFLFFSQFKNFYAIRKKLRRIQFWIRSKIFGIRYAYEDAQRSYGSLKGVIGLTPRSIVLAFLASIALQYCDQKLSVIYPLLGISIPKDGDYVTYFATIAGIGGVFIGLYYAAISTVGSAIYATVPNDVRGLLAQERAGNVYMKFLAFLTFFCLIIILFRLMGLPRNYLAVLFASIGGGVGIFAFVALGKRVFYLFDPTKLAIVVLQDIDSWVSKVQVGGSDWANKSVQSHTQQNASRCIATIEALAETAAKEAHLSGESLTELTRQLTRFLISYCGAKEKIPTDSLWYEQKYYYHDWYATDDSRVSLAHQSSTQIQPDIVRDYFWVETRIETILLRSVRTSFKQARYKLVLTAIDCIEHYLICLSRSGEVVRSYMFLEQLEDVIVSLIDTYSIDAAITQKSLHRFHRLSNILTPHIREFGISRVDGIYEGFSG